MIYFLIICGQLAIIIFQEMSFRRKDTIFENIMRRVNGEMNKLGNQLTAIAGIVHFLAFNRGLDSGNTTAEPAAADQDGPRL